MNASVDISVLLLVGYVACLIFLNFIAYQISTFYQKKIHQPAVRSGFLIAIVSLSCFILSQFLPLPNKEYLHIFQQLLLLIASGSTLWNSVNLYMTMKKVQK